MWSPYILVVSGERPSNQICRRILIISFHSLSERGRPRGAGRRLIGPPHQSVSLSLKRVRVIISGVSLWGRETPEIITLTRANSQHLTKSCHLYAVPTEHHHVTPHFLHKILLFYGIKRSICGEVFRDRKAFPGPILFSFSYSLFFSFSFCQKVDFSLSIRS